MFLHADHLGGTLLTTNSTGGGPQGVMDTPWGAQRLGGFATTTLNFTGQWRDDTGLLYYTAR
jgi:hypothetical protein